MSRVVRACRAACTASAARLPIRTTSSCSAASWVSKLWRMGAVKAVSPLPEASGDVVLCALVRGIGEDPRGGAELDQLPIEEEPGLVRHARGLLHVVCDDHD